MTKTSANDVRFRVLRALQDNPDMSQREIAALLGVSLGATNYCLRALVAKGQVKIRNFRASNNKARYAYKLTPKGIAEKSRLTKGFVERKLAEFEALKQEIEALRSDAPELLTTVPVLSDDPDQDTPGLAGQAGVMS